MKSLIQFFEESVENTAIMFICGKNLMINMKVQLMAKQESRFMNLLPD